MKKSTTKILLAVLLVGVVASIAFFSRKNDAIDIYINNRKIVSNVSAEVKDGTVFVPISVVAENVGVAVTWDEKTETYSLNDGDFIMTLKKGDNMVKIYNEETEIDSFEISPDPYFKNGTIMIPENAIFPLFGKEFALDEDNKAIYIVDKYSEMSAGAYGGDVSEEDKKLIMDNMRYIPRINDMFKDYEKNTVIFSQNSGFEIRQIARLNERVPGDYVSFSVEDDRSMDGFFSIFYIEKNTKKVYYSNGGTHIFSLPDLKVITTADAFNGVQMIDNGIVFEDEVDCTEVLRSFMIQKGKVQKDEHLFVKVYTTGDDPIMSLYRGKPTKSNEHVEDFIIRGRDIIMKSTGEKLYCDDAFSNRPEKQITEKNAGEELIKILKELKKEPKGDYTITDVKYVAYAEEIDKREGYTMSIFSSEQEQPTLYFISVTGNIAMQYDDRIGYYYIYGEYTPFG